MKPKLIFLSGLLCDSTIWSKQLDFFSSEYEVCAVDFRDLDNFQDMAQKVIKLIDASCTVIGHSMGARVALEVYRLAPQHISQLALLDFGIHGIMPGEVEKRIALIEAVHTNGMKYLIPHWLEPMMYPQNISVTEIFEPMENMVLSQTLNSFQAQIHALVHRPEVKELFAQINIPLYLGVGREDQWSTLSQHQAMLELNPIAQLNIYEQSGHMSPLEAAEQVNQSLKEWLKNIHE